MSHKHSHSDRIWQHKMRQHEAVPPAGGWEELNAALEASAAGAGPQASAAAVSASGERLLLWRLRSRIGAVAAVLLLGASAFAYLNSPRNGVVQQLDGLASNANPAVQALAVQPMAVQPLAAKAGFGPALPTAAAASDPAEAAPGAAHSGATHNQTAIASAAGGTAPAAGPAMGAAGITNAPVASQNGASPDRAMAQIFLPDSGPAQHATDAHAGGALRVDALPVQAPQKGGPSAAHHGDPAAQEPPSTGTITNTTAAATSNTFGNGNATLQPAPDVARLPATDAVDGSRSPRQAVHPFTPTRSVPNGIYGGISASANLSALLNAQQGPEDVNLNPGTRMGHAFGFTLGYRLDPHWSLEAGLIVDSRQGANFQSVMASPVGAFDVTKRVQLIYTQVPIYLRYGGLRPGFATDCKPRGGPATVFGVQYGMLRNSRLAVGNKPVSPDRDFNQHDLALLLGADYDIAVGSNGFFSVGLRGTYGLTRTHLTDLDGVNRDKRNATIGLRLAYNNWLSF